MAQPSDNIKLITDNLDAICQKFLTPLPRPTIIVACKGQPSTHIHDLWISGHRDYGENRIQEASARWKERDAQYPGLRLHFIGPLQRNKALAALTLFDAIHTVDRESLVDALAEQRALAPTRTDTFFIQVNTGEEPQKSGVHPSRLASLLAHCSTRRLPIRGLMCIPPVQGDRFMHFALLQHLAQIHTLPLLSMGMSNDYVNAARLGATHIRLGTAIFSQTSTL